MRGLIYLSLVICNIISRTSACPQGFTHCSGEGGSCSIANHISEGWLSYGGNNRYSLTAFSKPGGQGMSIACNNGNGDVVPGVGKHCCYKSGNTGFTTLRGDWTKNIQEGHSEVIYPYNLRYWMDVQRYGVDERYVYRPVSHSTAYCNNGFLPDSYGGKTKYCNYKLGEPINWATERSAQQWSWVECGNEGGECTGLSSSNNQYQWIKYGNMEYFLRAVSTTDGRVTCSNDLFGDPEPGTGKTCWRQSHGWDFSASPPSEIFRPSEDVKSVKWYNVMVHGNVSLNEILVIIITAVFVVLLIINCLCLCLTYGKNPYESVSTINSDSEFKV